MSGALSIVPREDCARDRKNAEIDQPSGNRGSGIILPQREGWAGVRIDSMKI
jgi:hypothetical protein